MKYIVACCLFAAALAAPQNYYQGQYRPGQYNQGQYNQGQYNQYQQPSYTSRNNVPIVSESNEINPDGSFRYSYATGDGQQAEAQGYLKNAGNKDAEAETIQGSYSYTAPDGTPISVTYVADENGYHAEGAHLPTPPPVPEAIQRALAYIAQTQRSNPQSQYDQGQGQYREGQYREGQYNQGQYSQGQYNQGQYRQPSFSQQQYRPRPFGKIF